MITLQKTSEDVKTIFFGLHPMFGCLGENWTSGSRMMISGKGHALPTFGPGW